MFTLGLGVKMNDSFSPKDFLYIETLYKLFRMHFNYFLAVVCHHGRENKEPLEELFSILSCVPSP